MKAGIRLFASRKTGQSSLLCMMTLLSYMVQLRICLLPDAAVIMISLLQHPPERELQAAFPSQGFFLRLLENLPCS